MAFKKNRRFAVRVSRDDDNTLYEIVGWGSSVVLHNPSTKNDIVVSNEDFKKNYKEISA